MPAMLRLAVSLFLLSAACASTREAGPAGSPVLLSLQDLPEEYDSHVGRRVRLQGFLIVESKPYSLYAGTSRPPGSAEPLEDGRLASHWCAAVDQASPLWVVGLHRAELAKIQPLARRPRNLVAQRVVLEGTLSPRNRHVGEIAVYHPYGLVGSDRIGSLADARVVSSEPVFCAGVAPDGQDRSRP
jgi:hypothetical protein